MKTYRRPAPSSVHNIKNSTTVRKNLAIKISIQNKGIADIDYSHSNNKSLVVVNRELVKLIIINYVESGEAQLDG